MIVMIVQLPCLPSCVEPFNCLDVTYKCVFCPLCFAPVCLCLFYVSDAGAVDLTIVCCRVHALPTLTVRVYLLYSDSARG